MAKKKNKVDTTLKRAEKLFKAGKFLLAEKEFEKIQKKLNRDDITEKLKICQKETRTIKGKDFLKQGHKAVNNNKLPEAIACFQEADKLLNEPWLTEPWITDKIKEIKHQITRQNIDAQAREAQASGDYLKAAELYIKTGGKKGGQEFLLKGACCLVKAERYDQAVTIFQPAFQTSALSHDPAIYYYGFALAKRGKYSEALKLWEKLDSNDKTFAEQNRQVLSLAGSTLYHNTLGKKVAIDGGHNEADYLLGLAKTLGDKRWIPRLEFLCAYYKLILIETLWEQEKFADIPDLLLQMAVFNDPMILGLNAKTYFNLSRKQSRFLKPMMTFWLSAIYSKEISAEFSDNPDDRQKVQHQLIRLAEQNINCQQDSQDTGYAASYLAIEKKLLTDLSAIFQKQSPAFDQICTPQYASISGLSDTILGVIKQSKPYFKDPEHYLETGGYYSKAGKALYALRTHDVKKAMTLIESIELSASTDEFTDYVLGLVQFEFGQAAVENHEKEYLHYFTLTPTLFESAPSIEKRFSNKIIQSHDDQMILYEELLMFLHTKRPSDPIAQALSFVMTQSCIIKFNHGKMTSRQMEVSIKKALKICPDNEFARDTLKLTLINLETDSIFNAMNKNKLSKAARLARQSAYPEVCDRYFKFGEEILDQITGSVMEPAFQKMSLIKLLNSFMMVDPDHPLVATIESKLSFMGDK